MKEQSIINDDFYLEESQLFEKEESLAPEDTQEPERIRIKLRDYPKIFRLPAVSTTWLPSVWWLLLWSLYVIGAAISSGYKNSQPILPIIGLLVILLLMGMTFKLERINNDHWLGVLVMNSMISVIIVPACLILNFYRKIAIQDPDIWNLEQKLGFFAIQGVALMLTDYHLLQTWNRWKAFLSGDNQSKAKLLLNPTVEGPIYLGLFFLLGLCSAGILCLLVKIEKNFPKPPLPFYHLAFLLVILLLSIGYTISLLIHKMFRNR